MFSGTQLTGHQSWRTSLIAELAGHANLGLGNVRAGPIQKQTRTAGRHPRLPVHGIHSSAGFDGDLEDLSAPFGHCLAK